MGLRNVPTSIKDPNLAGFLRELRAAVGGVSDQVTKLVQTRSSSGGGGGGPVDPGPVDPGPGGGGGDGYPPPAPTSLQAIPAAFSVTLVWTNPVIPDLQATEVWGRRSFDAWNASYEYLANAKVLVNGTVYRSRKAQDVNSTTNVVTLNKGFPPATSPTWWEATTLAPTDRSKIGESAGSSWIHDGLTPGETWAYWVRNRDIEDLYSTYFPADDIGVITTTLLDPGAYLDLLTNSITATQLYRDLGQRINLIDGPISLSGSVQNRVAAEALARETGIYNESVLRQNGDVQLASTLSVVSAKTDNNAAAIATEITARTAADSALSQRIDVVVAKADTNAAAITSEATARASADGTLGQRIDQVQAVGNNNSALITDVNQSKIGYCSIAGRTSEHGTRQACESAGGTWNIGLPWANAVKQVSVTANNGQTASLQQQFEAIYGTGGLRAQYTVKIDNEGWVSGFGLSSETQTDGTVVSDFGIRADRFWLAPPNSLLTAQGGPGTKLVNLGGGAVIRVETIYGVLGGQNGEFQIAYLQVDNLAGQSVKTLTGLDNYNPFTTNKNPNARRWIAMRNVRSSSSGALLEAWNQAFVPVAVGNFFWQDWRYGGSGLTIYASSLPGVTDASRVVVLGVNPLPTMAWGYSVNTTDTANDPAKIVAENLLPFIVTTTTKKYNNVDIPPGVFINNAFIANAMLGTAVMTGVIGSDNFVSGASGWQIDYAGNAEFNTVIVRSGANVGANALSWAYFYTQLTNNNSSRSNTFGPFSANTQHVMCWTPYFGSALSGSKALNIPKAPDRTTTIVCSLTFESPTKAVTTAVGYAIRQGANDGVWLELVSNNSVVQSITLFDAGGRDILARFFSSQGAFELTYAQANALSSAHVRVKIRQSNAISSESYYDNVRLFVQAFVS